MAVRNSRCDEDLLSPPSGPSLHAAEVPPPALFFQTSGGQPAIFDGRKKSAGCRGLRGDGPRRRSLQLCGRIPGLGGARLLGLAVAGSSAGWISFGGCGLGSGGERKGREDSTGARFNRRRSTVLVDLMCLRWDSGRR